MVHLEVELDCLQQHPLQGHDLLPGVGPELTELLIISKASNCFDQISTLLGCFLRFAREKECAGGGHIAGELEEAVEHVEPVKIDRGCGHSVMSEAQGLSNLLDKPGMYDYSSIYSDLLYSSESNTHTQFFKVKDVADNK